MDFFKSILGRIVTGLVALAVIAAGISWWSMDPSQRSAILSGVGRIAGWAGIVLIAPWAGFYLIGRIARMQSNAAGAALVAGLTLLELLLLGWLIGGIPHGVTGWSFFALGILLAAAYNLLICDWIAEILES